MLAPAGAVKLRLLSEVDLRVVQRIVEITHTVSVSREGGEAMGAAESRRGGREGRARNNSFAVVLILWLEYKV